MESAIYGGRVDNVFDMQVMVSYLKLFFDDTVLGDGARASKRLGPLRVPSSTSYRVGERSWRSIHFKYLQLYICFYFAQDFVESIEQLPEFDKPAYFGLPENIDRSSQRMLSSGVITQLRILKRPDVKSAKFDKDVWARELGPILNLWKKLNQV